MYSVSTPLRAAAIAFAAMAFGPWSAAAQQSATQGVGLRPATTYDPSIVVGAPGGADTGGLVLTESDVALLGAVQGDVRRACQLALRRNGAATSNQLQGVIIASMSLVDAPEGLKQLALVRMAGEDGLDPRISAAVQAVLSVMAATAQGLDGPTGDPGVSMGRLSRRIADSGGLNPGSPFGADGSAGGGGGPDYTAP